MILAFDEALDVLANALQGMGSALRGSGIAALRSGDLRQPDISVEPILARLPRVSLPCPSQSGSQGNKALQRPQLGRPPHAGHTDYG